MDFDGFLSINQESFSESVKIVFPWGKESYLPHTFPSSTKHFGTL